MLFFILAHFPASAVFYTLIDKDKLHNKLTKVMKFIEPTIGVLCKCKSKFLMFYLNILFFSLRRNINF